MFVLTFILTSNNRLRLVTIDNVETFLDVVALYQKLRPGIYSNSFYCTLIHSKMNILNEHNVLARERSREQILVIMTNKMRRIFLYAIETICNKRSIPSID